jgi:hypothetical protein
MSTTRKYLPFFASSLLMVAILFIIYPRYQYYIDPDGTAYLAISKRYADGDFQRAINGLWSPWACWVTALFMNLGLPVIPASVVTNALGAVGFLFITQSFFLKFNIANKLQWIFNVTLVFFLCFAIFWQSFDDLWQCFFLLSAFRIMLAEEFKNKPWLWVTCGIVGALSYFAKAYDLPFFLLNTVCCTYFISKDKKAQWLKISFVTIAVMLVCSLPWIYALHYKYGKWMVSTTGPLNMAWFLVGHPDWRAGIDVLLPPTYKNSPSFWEDPYLIHGAMPNFWDSFYFAQKQLLRLWPNACKIIISWLQLSVFFPVIVATALFFLKPGKIKSFFTGNARILVISFLLFSLGYIPVDCASRLFWYMLPLSMIILVLFTQNLSVRKWQNRLCVIYALTILVFPAAMMKKMYNEGINDYRTAMQIDSLHIRGSFTCMANGRGLGSQRAARLAYFSGNQLYTVSRPGCTEKDILKEMRRYRVNYFIAYGDNATESTFNDELGRPFPELIKGRIAGLKVFVVDP